jgi:hypothetical protein
MHCHFETFENVRETEYLTPYDSLDYILFVRHDSILSVATARPGWPGKKMTFSCPINLLTVRLTAEAPILSQGPPRQV